MRATRTVAALLGVALTASCSCQRDRSGTADAPNLVEVPAASFILGCTPERDPGCSPTEQPAHAISVAAFRIDRTEVTQAAYQRCVEAGRCTAPARDFDPAAHPRRPVTHVTWSQARAYCAFRGLRLPTEAEWELAARGTDGRIFPWGDEPPDCDRAHLRECGARPAEVGGRAAGQSPYGVLDLAGNVDEWVEDVYRAYGDPGEAEHSNQRVARGGAWDAWHSRSTARSALGPEHVDALLGFRCASSR